MWSSQTLQNCMSYKSRLRLYKRKLWILKITYAAITPEKAEGAKPAEFAEAFLANLLGLQNLLPTFVVERAH